ncbi:MAG: type II toxin-antitoxin system HipA family toxin [Granulosicoccaceae bacterium]
MAESLSVWHGTSQVGELYLGADQRSIGLHYTQAWREQGLAISQSLPLGQADYSPEQGRAHLWFGNLLPEEGSRAALVRRLGVSDDDFSLLRALGGDCAGALRLLPAGEENQASAGQTAVDRAALKAWAAGRDRYGLLQGSAGSAARLSLAGAQDKIPIVLEGEHIFLPQGARPSSHILKFAHKPGIVINELCMNTLAERVGITCPHTQVLRVEGEAMLAVQRFDRVNSACGLQRLHQEDMCQALGLPRNKKYQTDGGPDLAACARLLRRSTTAPAKAIAQLLQWQIFNVLAGNSDGHAKNISLLQNNDGGWQLAPSYDLVCTRILPYDPSLAFAVGEQFNPQQVIKRDWQAMATDLGVTPPFAIKQVVAMARALKRELTSEIYRRVLLERGMHEQEWEQMQHLRRYVSQQCSKALKLLA